jgi:exopolysaccharide biosynthesis predicted pyruvyltransferase EpsI
MTDKDVAASPQRPRSLLDRRTDGALISLTQSRIKALLQPLLAGTERIALLDYPNHSNVGDSAIWLGELAFLRSCGLPRPVYVCDIATYSSERLRTALGSGTILLHGGGNLGDLWPQHQRFRERIILDFPNNPIIQLPQSIHYQDPVALDNTRAILDGHASLTLLLRDEHSLNMSRANFRAPSHLCPDMAFFLGELRGVARPRRDIVWLARRDTEARTDWYPEPSDEVEVVDWLDEPVTIANKLEELLRHPLENRPNGFRALAMPVARLRDRIARDRLRRGVRLLSRGRVVITDRLHAHILCLLLGIPHVLVDNSYGKLSRFFEAWTHDAPIAYWCDHPREALEMARRLVRQSIATEG